MATNQNEGNGPMIKVCNFFKDFFDEEVKGKKRLTGASLKNDYGVTKYSLSNLNPHCSYPLCNSLISNIRIF